MKNVKKTTIEFQITRNSPPKVFWVKAGQKLKNKT